MNTTRRITARVETAINLTTTENAQVELLAAAINNPQNAHGDTLTNVESFLRGFVIGSSGVWLVHRRNQSVTLTRVNGCMGETCVVLAVST